MKEGEPSEEWSKPEALGAEGERGFMSGSEPEALGADGETEACERGGTEAFGPKGNGAHDDPERAAQAHSGLSF